jgi:hypothetical protein
MAVPQRPNSPVLELPSDLRPAYANLARIAHSGQIHATIAHQSLNMAQSFNIVF